MVTILQTLSLVTPELTTSGRNPTEDYWLEKQFSPVRIINPSYLLSPRCWGSGMLSHAIWPAIRNQSTQVIRAKLQEIICIRTP